MIFIYRDFSKRNGGSGWGKMNMGWPWGKTLLVGRWTTMSDFQLGWWSTDTSLSYVITAHLRIMGSFTQSNHWSLCWNSPCLPMILWFTIMSLVKTPLYAILRSLPSGNQPWQWKIPWESRFWSKNHWCLWSIFQHAMWLITGGCIPSNPMKPPLNQHFPMVFLWSCS